MLNKNYKTLLSWAFIHGAINNYSYPDGKFKNAKIRTMNNTQPIYLTNPEEFLDDYGSADYDNKYLLGKVNIPDYPRCSMPMLLCDVVCGSGNTPPSADDYTMPNLITDLNHLSTIMDIDNKTGKMFVTATYQNPHPDKTITVKEIGLIKALAHKSYNSYAEITSFLTATNTECNGQSYGAILLGREVLPEPVTLGGNEACAFTFEINNMEFGYIGDNQPSDAA